MPMNFSKTALLLAVLTGIFVAMGWLMGGPGGMLIAFLVALGMNLFALFRSDRLILKMHNAQEVDAGSGGQFYAIVRAMSERAGLPMPRVFIMQTPQPNAFATGRNPENAVVCASTGLIELLTPEEVAGVMAHELAHVKNHDTLTMTVAASLGGAISMVAQYLQFGAVFGNRGNQKYGWLGFILTASGRPVRRHARADGDLAIARVSGGSVGLDDLRQSALARLGAGENPGRGEAHAQRHRRPAPGNGTSVHRQPVDRARRRQFFLDAPEH